MGQGSGGDHPVTEAIDVTFDFHADTRRGRDPDTFSPTLARYHQILWGKPLPSGALFNLHVRSRPPYYLTHTSDVGSFTLSSDTVIRTYSSRTKEMGPVIAQIPQEETNGFKHLMYTIGGMMVWPANRIDGMRTINGERGCLRSLQDRFDLTVECIRRHYIEVPSPLTAVLARYADFFGLFGDFDGFVDFFLLQDLVDERTSMVKFFMPFEAFAASPWPRPLETYLAYRESAMGFIHARNHRIASAMEARARA